jgi:hypothetical protein
MQENVYHLNGRVSPLCSSREERSMRNKRAILQEFTGEAKTP